jgi:hypothetical protein
MTHLERRGSFTLACIGTAFVVAAVVSLAGCCRAKRSLSRGLHRFNVEAGPVAISAP